MTPIYDDGQAVLFVGDALDVLRDLPDESVNCSVTSPPYWKQRDYGVSGQLGQEDEPADYIDRLVTILHELHRVLHSDGTLWLNLADSSRNKQLQMIPARVALALQADGWWLRSDIVWHKPNPMPESVTDRPTRAHEYLFLLSKSANYYYDAAAIRTPATDPAREPGLNSPYAPPVQAAHTGNRREYNGKHSDKQRGHSRRHDGFNDRWDAMSREEQMALGANKRDVWTVATNGFSGAHFATFPPKLIEPCILAGCPEGGVVLDPFIGSGTTAAVCKAFGRRCIGVDLNEQYLRDFAIPQCQQQSLLIATAG